MKTNILRVLIKSACVASVLTAVACTATTSDEPRAKTRSTSSAASVHDAEEEGSADKVSCAVDADCDLDERCQSGSCVGLDGDRN